jgi:hypothetical protein
MLQEKVFISKVQTIETALNQFNQVSQRGHHIFLISTKLLQWNKHDIANARRCIILKIYEVCIKLK